MCKTIWLVFEEHDEYRVPSLAFSTPEAAALFLDKDCKRKWPDVEDLTRQEWWPIVEPGKWTPYVYYTIESLELIE